ncbi:Ribosomal RNA small subunit methyltransferase D [bacterium HR19]|nr:Ribosomal RNA small subunit methyltransferase D [bacterium HR19]
MGEIRITGGEFRGRIIRFPDEISLRPLTSFIRKAVFDSIDVEGAEILDLFAGSGSFGIEALSRGAKRVVFVEKSKKLSDAILKNLHALGIKSCKVVNQDVMSFLKSRSGREKYDIVFCDPPFSMNFDKDFFPLVKNFTRKYFILRRQKGKEIGDEKMLSEFFPYYKKRIYSDSVIFFAFERE